MQANPSFSLRMFANLLGCEPIALSRYFSGKRRISAKTIVRMAERLGLHPEETRMYIAGLKAGIANAPWHERYVQVDNETFEVISNWKYFAILEATYLKDFQPDVGWVSKKLGLNPIECRFAVNTLVRLGMLEIDGEGAWKDKFEFLTGNIENYTDLARRLLQKQVIEQSLYALETVPISKRSQTSMTFAGSYVKMERAKELIAKFRRELTDLMQEDGEQDQVYQLSISLFPISK